MTGLFCQVDCTTLRAESRRVRISSQNILVLFSGVNNDVNYESNSKHLQEIKLANTNSQLLHYTKVCLRYISALSKYFLPAPYLLVGLNSHPSVLTTSGLENSVYYVTSLVCRAVLFNEGILIMPVCVGIAFKRVAKSYWFDPDGLKLEENDRVVVETTRGLELGLVKIVPREIVIDELQSPLKRVLRLAEDTDLEQERENRIKARQALALCQDKVKKHNLTMKLLQAEFNFDSSQITIYFAAEARVDFRELVRDVAAQLHCKVQLHQVGARDQAKMIGGIGPCGLTLCCATFLSDFAPISMKMAKDQSLFLNPVKFSGVCGKLMCCLRYEHETYVDAKKRLPQIGEIVMSPKGQGKVMDLNLLKEVAIVQLLESKVELEFPAAELRIEKIGKCHDCRGCSIDQLKENEDEAIKVDVPTRQSALNIASERVRDFASEEEALNADSADLEAE